MSLPLATSQSFSSFPPTDRPPQTENSHLPSAEKARLLTGREWPSNVCSSLPVERSQSLIASSALPVARELPSGENETAETTRSCPSSDNSAFPSASNTRAVPFFVGRVASPV